MLSLALALVKATQTIPVAKQTMYEENGTMKGQRHEPALASRKFLNL